MRIFKNILLVGLILPLVSCISGKSQAPIDTKKYERFQTFNFASDLETIIESLALILKEKGFEIQKSDPIQLTALNTELTSIDILNYAVEKPKLTEAVYSGEVIVVIDFLEAPAGGAFIHIKPKIKAVVGRTAMLKNEDWQGEVVSFHSNGRLENEIFKALARQLKEKKNLAILITRDVELEGGFTLQ